MAISINMCSKTVQGKCAKVGTVVRFWNKHKEMPAALFAFLVKKQYSALYNFGTAVNKPPSIMLCFSTCPSMRIYFSFLSFCYFPRIQ